MHLGKAGWLSTLLAQAVTAHDARAAKPLLEGAAATLSTRAQARVYLRRVLRKSGLLYGTPASGATAVESSAPEEQLFLAVVRTYAKIALDIAAIARAPAGASADQLLFLFATLTADIGLAEDVRKALAKAGTPIPAKLYARVEAGVTERAMSLAGDPVYGLVLHNGAVFADAQFFGRQAIELFTRGHVSKAATERRIAFFAQRKAILAEVLTALACAERPPSFPSRRAILRQIDDLRLPKQLAEPLVARVKKAFEKSPSLKAVVQPVRSAELRRFILEQTLLASLVDGRRSKTEIDFIHELAALFRMEEALPRIELEMAEFYAQNRSVVDVFTVAAGAEGMGEELVESMQRTLEKNFQALLTEIRETGELSVLLSRAARGHTLTAPERRLVREQLIDIAKAIPALAIFAAPGGVLLLVALAKVLPFNLLPSAFQDAPKKSANE